MTEQQKMAPLTQVLRDNDGNPSSMRLMMLISLAVAVALAGLLVFGVAKCPGPVENLALYFLGASFGGKVFQKFAEVRKGG